MIRKLSRTILTSLVLSFCWANLNAQNFEDILWTADVGSAYTAVGGSLDTLFLFTNETGALNHKLPVAGTITNIKRHPKEDLMAISIQIITEGEKTFPGGVMMLNTKTMTTQKLEGIPTSGARALGWNPTGELLAVGDNEGNLHVFDRSFSLVKKVDTGLRSITGLSWHPTRPVVTMVSGRIGNYDLEKDEMQVWESRKEEMLLLSVAWHPSGAFFALADYGDYYQNYPAQLQFHKPDGSLIKVMQGSKAEYRNIQWTADGKQLITVSDAFRVWAKDGELISTLPFEHLLWGLSYDSVKQQWVTTDEAGQVHRVSKDGKELIESISLKQH